MIRLSSNLTLFYKVFFPVFWLSFFGALTVAVWYPQSTGLDTQFSASTRFGVFGFWLLGVLGVSFLAGNLKRVEADEQFVYVSNYWKHVRYPWHQIMGLQVRNRGFWKKGVLFLHQSGTFGDRIPFIVSRRNWEILERDYPAIWQGLKPDTSSPKTETNE